MKRPVIKLVAVLWIKQLSLLYFSAAVFWYFEPVLAYSVLYGGLIYWVPNAYFTWLALRYRNTRFPVALVLSFYRGEVGKFLLTATGFAIVFVFVDSLSYLALFSAYIAMTVSQWLLVSRWQ
jgi:ATP synthase protein I